jgi:hypothetical protein
MGIAALSQPLISASRASDFQINKIDRTKIPLVMQPEFPQNLSANLHGMLVYWGTDPH